MLMLNVVMGWSPKDNEVRKRKFNDMTLTITAGPSPPKTCTYHRWFKEFLKFVVQPHLHGQSFSDQSHLVTAIFGRQKFFSFFFDIRFLYEVDMKSSLGRTALAANIWEDSIPVGEARRRGHSTLHVFVFCGSLVQNKKYN